MYSETIFKSVSQKEQVKKMTVEEIKNGESKNIEFKIQEINFFKHFARLPSSLNYMRVVALSLVDSISDTGKVRTTLTPSYMARDMVYHLLILF